MIFRHDPEGADAVEPRRAVRAVDAAADVVEAEADAEVAQAVAGAR